MNGKLITTGIICFGLGVIAGKCIPDAGSNGLSVNTASNSVQTNINAAANPLALAESSPTEATPRPVVQSPQSAISASSSNITHLPAEKTTTSTQPLQTAATGGAGKVKFTQRTELSDESIDALVPKPFNGHVKLMQADIKNKFANYLQSETQNDSDTRAQQFLNDAINRGQLAGIAEVNFIGCKASLCEVRLFERTPNETMPLITKQLMPYHDYFQVAATSMMTDESQQTHILYVVEVKATP